MPGLRIAALLCGLAAGLILIALPRQAGIDLMPAFLKLWPAATEQQMLAKVVWYAIPAAAIVGGVLALLVPGFGALLMLAAGIGWAGIELAVPGQFQYLAASPAVLCGLGMLFAYIAGEMKARRRREERRSRRELGLAPVRRADPETLAREAAFRMDPLTMERRPSAPVTPTSTRPKLDIPLTLEDAATHHREDPRPAPAPVAPVIHAEDAPKPAAAPASAAAGYVHPAVQRGRTESAERRPNYEPERRRGGLVASMVAINVVVLALVGLGVGYLLLNRDDGRAVTQALVGDTPATTGSITPAAVSTPAAVTQASYADPFAYCAAVGTIDRIDGRYAGPDLIPEMADALHIPQNSARDRYRWRCANGIVMACTSFGWPICDTTPDATEMLAFCQRNPEVSRLLAPNGTWACKAGRPVIPEDASWPVDDRGFLPKAWQAVLKAGTAPAVGG